MRKYKASTILCRTKIEKTNGVLACKDGKMCADGVLLHAMGYPIEDITSVFYVPLSEFGNVVGYDEREKKRENFYKKIKKRYGIDQAIWHDIAYHNDKGWSFKKIAKWLKEKGL